MDFWKSLNASKHPVSTPTRPAKEEWDAGQKTARPFSVIGGVSEQIRGSELGKQEKGFEMGGGGVDAAGKEEKQAGRLQNKRGVGKTHEGEERKKAEKTRLETLP